MGRNRETKRELTERIVQLEAEINSLLNAIVVSKSTKVVFDQLRNSYLDLEAGHFAIDTYLSVMDKLHQRQISLDKAKGRKNHGNSF